MELYPFDDDYVRRLAEHDHGAIDHFVSYFHGILFEKLRRRLDSKQAIDDVVQEVFARVLQHISEIENGQKLGAFVNSICNSVLRERYQPRPGGPPPWLSAGLSAVDLRLDDFVGVLKNEVVAPHDIRFPLIVVAWDPGVVPDAKYVELIAALDHLARSYGVDGLKRVASDSVVLQMTLEASQ